MRERSRLQHIIVILLTACVILGMFHAGWDERLAIPTNVSTGTMNASFTACWTDDPPGTVDPGYTKDVAWSEATLGEPDGHGRIHSIDAMLHNTYPCYTTQVGFTIANEGTIPERIAAIEWVADPELDVATSDLLGMVLDPGQSLDGTVTVHVLQQAEPASTYSFTVLLYVAQWSNGTIGFWGRWDRHQTFTHEEIEAWLACIDAGSQWLGPVDIEGMEAVLNSASGSDAKKRFLGHYLATRLNLSSGLLGETRTHDVSSIDPGNYLSLSNPSAATVPEIVDAIEMKSGTSPTRAQYNMMKDVCDALNNRSI